MFEKIWGPFTAFVKCMNLLDDEEEEWALTDETLYYG